jgi:hypothetical protein
MLPSSFVIPIPILHCRPRPSRSRSRSRSVQPLTTPVNPSCFFLAVHHVAPTWTSHEICTIGHTNECNRSTPKKKTFLRNCLNAPTNRRPLSTGLTAASRPWRPGLRVDTNKQKRTTQPETYLNRSSSTKRPCRWVSREPSRTF